VKSIVVFAAASRLAKSPAVAVRLSLAIATRHQHTPAMGRMTGRGGIATRLNGK